ncbi:hypothetical protein Q2V57_13805 [Enterobacter bugandensis]|jgi:hypothetical protein|uniref:Uncharacterized protein n=1 Tax=Enterobacter bugandensis TaxID=881260 RepID=A0A7Y8YPI7_9ENTR|nr:MULTISPECIES: hypothetical protein [Enterobacter]EKS6889215.1 hypothetical protein [Enterobacter bugandensis]EKS6931401.1 hypothetical protein [Enterobacter bugandensis]EKS7121817.1 hypothetical protein [Enterobacter bugandensis]EKV5174563.1 hypothetical protein [Enterobacter bugandensis]ELF8873406.1 hypothetical protein [Enterobacter bugandensis]
MSHYGKIIGAGIAGLVTLAGTYLWGKNNGKDEGIAEGQQIAKAEYAEKIKKLQTELADKMRDISKRDDFILAAYALGTCCIKANGKTPAENIALLDDAVSGLVPREKLPQAVQQKIVEMVETPPNLPTVWSLINEYQLNDAKSLERFSLIVGMMASQDELRTQSESDFMASWNLLVAA